MDNLITGSARNIEHIKTDKFSYIKHDVTKPLYVEAKRYAEAITMAYHRYHKLDTRIEGIYRIDDVGLYAAC